jgi:hypothetical protein
MQTAISEARRIKEQSARYLKIIEILLFTISIILSGLVIQMH